MTEMRVWSEGDAEPDDALRVRDRWGDVWYYGGLWWVPYTNRRGRWSSVLAEFGPLTEVGVDEP